MASEGGLNGVSRLSDVLPVGSAGGVSGAGAGGPGGGRRKARGCKSRPGFTEENQGRLWLGEVRPN